jgi:hypothetical protein
VVQCKLHHRLITTLAERDFFAVGWNVTLMVQLFFGCSVAGQLFVSAITRRVQHDLLWAAGRVVVDHQ